MQNSTLQYGGEGNIPDVVAHASPSFSLSEIAVNLLHMQICVYPSKLNSARAFILQFSGILLLLT